MNFTQLQERVRLELLRRIERGTASISLLSRQTGLGQGHLSNFLRSRRGMSLGSLDRILAALRMGVGDLLPARQERDGALLSGQVGELVRIPLVTGQVAMYEPYIRASSVLTMLPFAAGLVRDVAERCGQSRRQWERFVAVRLTAGEAAGMEPVLTAGCVVVLDRHYTSFHPYREGEANLYGARAGPSGARFVVRYAQLEGDRVVLRAWQGAVRAEVVELGAGEAAQEVLVGRVVVWQGTGERG